MICCSSKVKTLGESDSEDDAQAWVEKSRKRQLEKAQAEKTVIRSSANNCFNMSYLRM